MKTFEKMSAEIDTELAKKRKINEKGAKFVSRLEVLFNSPKIDEAEIRDTLSQYRQFLLKSCDKKDVEEMLEKYYKKLENL